MLKYAAALNFFLASSFMFAKIKHFSLILALFLISSNLQATVKDIERLNSTLRFQEAYQLGQLLLVKEAGNPAFDMAFGVAALRLAEYDQALFAFERVLIYNNKIQVARFELARTYFLLDDLVMARHHFNQLLDVDPSPPSAAIERIQWYIAAINAKESGQSVANSDGVMRLHLGVRLGSDSNPSNMTHKDLFPGFTVNDDVDSDTYHELYADVVRYQQQTESWAWFVGANANLRGYHDRKSDMSSYSLGLQAGGLLLDKNWRLSLPIQINKQVREDKNEVTVLAMAAEFNQRLSSNLDYTFFGQAALVDYKLGSNQDTKSFTAGVIYSYRLIDKLKIYAGPIFGLENARSDVYSRNLYGVRTGAGYTINDKQRFDFNFNYMNSEHKIADTIFKKVRSDDQFSMGIKFSQRYLDDWLFDLGLQQSTHDSTLNLYSYNRTQLSAGIRKEW